MGPVSPLPQDLVDTALRLRNLSVGHSQSWPWGPWAARRPGPSGSQALGHSGAAGSHGRAENRVGAHGLDLAWGQGEKRGVRLVPRDESLVGQW